VQVALHLFPHVQEACKCNNRDSRYHSNLFLATKL
jgi:hypothetical protein